MNTNEKKTVFGPLRMDLKKNPCLVSQRVVLHPLFCCLGMPRCETYYIGMLHDIVVVQVFGEHFIIPIWALFIAMCLEVFALKALNC